MSFFSGKSGSMVDSQRASENVANEKREIIGLRSRHTPHVLGCGMYQPPVFRLIPVLSSNIRYFR